MALASCVAGMLAGCSLFVDVPDLSANFGGDGSSVVDGPADAGGRDAGAADVEAGAAADYQATILAEKPRAYFRFGEPPGDGVARDEVGGPSATYVGTVGLGSPSLVGDSNTAAAFDGASAGVQAGTSVDFAAREPFTFEMWVEALTIDSANRMLFNKDGQSGGRQQFGAYLQRDEGLTFERWVDGVAVVARTPFETGAPHHIVLTYDGAELAVYVDGSKRATAPDARAQAPKPSSNLVIGWDGVTGNPSYFHGVLDELAIYGRALGAEDVTRHHDAGRGLR